MIVQYKNETRTRYLLRVAAEYIDQCDELLIDYDGTECDGGCLAQELREEADQIL